MQTTINTYQLDFDAAAKRLQGVVTGRWSFHVVFQHLGCLEVSLIVEDVVVQHSMLGLTEISLVVISPR